MSDSNLPRFPNRAGDPESAIRCSDVYQEEGTLIGIDSGSSIQFNHLLT